jgi:HAMP domain-containing protein
MKRKTVLFSLVALFAAATVCFAAENLNMGTWKLNEAKSKIAAGTPKNTTVSYVAAGDSIKVTVEGVDAAGKPTHNEWTGKFDGKDYAVTGDSESDMRSYKEVNAHTLTLTMRKAGKVTQSGTIVVSADGKSRTVNLTSTDAKGTKVTSTAIYDKQ